MMRDLPYKRGLTWRKRSFLLEAGNEELLESWRKTFEEATACSVWLLSFGRASETTSVAYEPVMKYYGGWRSLGPGRKYTDEEILEADDLVGIELIRERFPA